MNEAQFSEPVHEEADPRPGRADHFRQHLLTDLGDYRLGFAFLAKMGEQQKDPGQPLLARIEKLINQIFFVPDVPRKQNLFYFITLLNSINIQEPQHAMRWMVPNQESPD